MRGNWEQGRGGVGKGPMEIGGEKEVFWSNLFKPEHCKYEDYLIKLCKFCKVCSIFVCSTVLLLYS